MNSYKSNGSKIRTYLWGTESHFYSLIFESKSIRVPTIIFVKRAKFKYTRPNYSKFQYTRLNYSKFKYTRPNYSKFNYTRLNYSKFKYARPNYSKFKYTRKHHWKYSRIYSNPWFEPTYELLNPILIY